MASRSSPSTAVLRTRARPSRGRPFVSNEQCSRRAGSTDRQGPVDARRERIRQAGRGEVRDGRGSRARATAVEAVILHAYSRKVPLGGPRSALTTHCSSLANTNAGSVGCGGSGPYPGPVALGGTGYLDRTTPHESERYAAPVPSGVEVVELDDVRRVAELLDDLVLEPPGGHPAGRPGDAHGPADLVAA